MTYQRHLNVRNILFPPRIFTLFRFPYRPEVGLTTFTGCATDLKTQFLEVARRFSPEQPRDVHVFMTTAIVRIIFVPYLGVWGVGAPDFFLTDYCFFSFSLVRVAQDTRAMASILQVIRLRIVCDNLQNAELIQ